MDSHRWMSDEYVRSLRPTWVRYGTIYGRRRRSTVSPPRNIALYYDAACRLCIRCVLFSKFACSQRQCFAAEEDCTPSSAKIIRRVYHHDCVKCPCILYLIASLKSVHIMPSSPIGAWGIKQSGCLLASVCLSVCLWVCESVSHFYISWMNGDISLKLITVTDYQSTWHWCHSECYWVKGHGQPAMAVEI